MSSTPVRIRWTTSSPVFQPPAKYAKRKRTFPIHPSNHHPMIPAPPQTSAKTSGTFHFFPAPTTEGNCLTSSFTPLNIFQSQNLGAVGQLSLSKTIFSPSLRRKTPSSHFPSSSRPHFPQRESGGVHRHTLSPPKLRTASAKPTALLSPSPCPAVA